MLPIELLAKERRALYQQEKSAEAKIETREANINCWQRGIPPQRDGGHTG